jgi:hypothetical protein
MKVFSPHVDHGNSKTPQSSSDVLVRFRDNVCQEPYVSNGRIGGKNDLFQPCFRKRKDLALDYPIIQHNGPHRLAYIPVDVDRSDAAYAWRDNGKPEPNIIVVNPENGHAHLFYELATPAWKNGKPGPLRYYNNTRRALTHELGGDSGYGNFLAKNPLSDKWIVQVVRQRPYDLRELAAELDMSKPQAKLVDNAEGRNCTLFDSIRHWARRVVRAFASIDDFRSAMADQLDMLNDEFPEPLPHQELRSILRSVSRYTWARKPLSYAEEQRRQSIAALKTSAQRADATFDKLIEARRLLEAAGKPITNKTMSEQAGVSTRTMRRYRERLLVWSLGRSQGGIPDSDSVCPPPCTTNPDHRKEIQPVQPASIFIGQNDNEEPRESERIEPIAPEEPAPSRRLTGTDIGRIIVSSRGAPTYDDLRAKHTDNTIKITRDVLDLAKHGRLVPGLPEHLRVRGYHRLGIHVEVKSASPFWARPHPRAA